MMYVKKMSVGVTNRKNTVLGVGYTGYAGVG